MRPPVVLARAGNPYLSHEGVHVTIPRRTDTASRETLALQHMKLLAELPHVGETPVAQPVESEFVTETAARSARTLKSSHPAFAELAELPEEAPVQRGPRPTRFVDRAHVDHEWELSEDQDEDDFEPRERVSRAQKRVVAGRSHSRSARQQTGWRPLLSQVHSQIAPFAGLIVTAALMASAALLFWMMLGGQQPGAEFNDFALPGDGFRVEASEPDYSTTQAIGEPPLAEADFAPTTEQPENSEYVQPTTPAEQSPLEMQPHTVPTDTSAATMQPIIEQIDDSPAQLGQLMFPKTSSPLELDYSKALNNSGASLQELPAVAERADAATAEPINR